MGLWAAQRDKKNLVGWDHWEQSAVESDDDLKCEESSGVQFQAESHQWGRRCDINSLVSADNPPRPAISQGPALNKQGIPLRLPYKLEKPPNLPHQLTLQVPLFTVLQGRPSLNLAANKTLWIPPLTQRPLRQVAFRRYQAINSILFSSMVLVGLLNSVQGGVSFENMG